MTKAPPLPNRHHATTIGAPPQQAAWLNEKATLTAIGQSIAKHGMPTFAPESNPYATENTGKIYARASDQTRVTQIKA